jgi:hypothetical protein
LSNPGTQFSVIKSSTVSRVDLTMARKLPVTLFLLLLAATVSVAAEIEVA